MTNLKIIFTHKRYFAAAQLLLALSLMFGTWVIYIPSITTKLGLSRADLGIVLLFGAIGSLVSLPLGSKIIQKIGEGKLALFGTIFYTLSLIGNFLSTSFVLLSVSLFFNGITSSLMQLGINSIISTLEKEDGVSIMSSCHGFFSLGGLFSAGFGTVIMLFIGNPLLHILLMVSFVLVMQGIYAASYSKHKRESAKEHENKGSSHPVYKNATLWGLAVIAVSVMVSEGAIADWSGLFLRDVVNTSPNMVGLGYAFFSVSMTAGRFLGDHFSTRFGAFRVIITGLIISIAGFILVLTANSVTTLGGFLLIGAGFSTIVPEVYRLSTNIKGVPAPSGIAFMAGSGYLGFLAGPVVLGAIAENFGLKISFSALLAIVAISALFSIVIGKKRSR